MALRLIYQMISTLLGWIVLVGADNCVTVSFMAALTCGVPEVGSSV
jgi:hypothetical protein